MYIIRVTVSDIGSRPVLQTWSGNLPPEGYAFCPDEFVEIFYSTSPAGFVNIQIEDNIVVSMEINQEALDAYIASLPEPEPELPTAQEDTDAMLVDHEYRLTLLELGVM